ncbi:MAG: hypothetical protein J6X45_06105 [Lachnospiraceae bacterium]|nr:hypothetical protein [Lachnospiraceae bacterium]
MAKFTKKNIEALKEADKNPTLKEAVKELKEALKSEVGYNALSAVANDEPVKQFVGEVKIDLNNPPVEEVKEDYLLEKVDATESRQTEEYRIRLLNAVFFYKNLADIARKRRNEASFCNVAPEEITKEFIVATKKWEYAKINYEKYEKDCHAKTVRNTFIYSISCESCDSGVYPAIVYITESSAFKILNNPKIEKKFIHGTENIMCYQNGYEIRLIRYCLGELPIDKIYTLEDALHQVLLDDKRFKSAEDQEESELQ